MANIQPRKNKEGKIISYSIRVFKGRDINGKQLKPYTKTFFFDEKWSEKKIQAELQKAATLFENECKNGIVADNKQSFERYANYVINLKERIGIKHRTIVRYKELLERINPATNIYTHILHEADKKASDKLENILLNQNKQEQVVLN